MPCFEQWQWVLWPLGQHFRAEDENWIGIAREECIPRGVERPIPACQVWTQQGG